MGAHPPLEGKSLPTDVLCAPCPEPPPYSLRARWHLSLSLSHTHTISLSKVNARRNVASAKRWLRLQITPLLLAVRGFSLLSVRGSGLLSVRGFARDILAELPLAVVWVVARRARLAIFVVRDQPRLLSDLVFQGLVLGFGGGDSEVMV